MLQQRRRQRGEVTPESGEDDAVFAMIATLLSQGENLNWHPDADATIVEGAFIGDRRFVPMPPVPMQRAVGRDRAAGLILRAPFDRAGTSRGTSRVSCTLLMKERGGRRTTARATPTLSFRGGGADGKTGPVPIREGDTTSAGWHRGIGPAAAYHPELWARTEDGGPVCSFGPQLSVHHPGSLEETLAVMMRMMDRFPMSGIVWDEIKCLTKTDCSDEARRRTGGISSGDTQYRATAAFFSRLSTTT